MSEFLQRAEAAMQSRRLFPRGQKILVAVSGGADSMVLLHVLNALAAKYRWKISIAHFNHRLRGKSSDADEQLVRQTAANLRLKFFPGSADVKAFAARAKISVEMAARKLRHEFLARTARGQKISVIALAHHADDQVELFFLRLLRGAGGEGLAGMKWRSPSPADKKITLVRPLLDFSKAELSGFARENRIAFRDDATNFSADFLRNRIRNELLPLLRKQYQPGLDQAILRLMDIVGAEAEFVAAAAAQFCNPQSVIHNSFDVLPLAVQRRVLQQQLIKAGLLPDFELIERLRQSPGKLASVTARLSVARDAAGQIVCRELAAGEFKAGEIRMKLPGGAGEAEFGGRGFRWRVGKFSGLQRRLARPTELFDADKIGVEVVLRHWRPGDRFQPIGMKSAVKLQDLFVNAKVPAARRRELVLAATASGAIFWVEGLRISEKFKLTPETRRVLAWKPLKIAG